jgi:hypothetical protein
VTLVVMREYYFRSRLLGVRGCRCLQASITVDGSRWDIRWLIGRRTKPTFYGFPAFSLAVRRKCVVTLAVTGSTISCRVFRRQRVPLFQRHRLLLIGSRWDIRWMICRRTKPTFYGFPVVSVAVMEKCCDACGYGEYYFRSSFSASEGAGVSEASIVVDRKSMGHTMDDRSSNEADFLWISCI